MATTQYGATGKGDPRSFSIRTATSGDPTTGTAITKFPYNVARNFTHESVYNEVKEVVNRYFLTLFDNPDPILQLILPIYPTDEETMSWTETFGKAKPMPQYSHQAPMETFYLHKTRLEFDMNWHGLMFALDNSILNTPAESFLKSAHAQILQASMNLTIFVEVIGNIINQPSMLHREFDYQTKKRANPLDESAALGRQIHLMETLPGILDRGDTFQNGLGYLMEHANNHLTCFRADSSLKPNFFMLSTTLADALMTRTEVVDSGLSEAHIQKYMREATGQPDLMWYLNPIAIRKFRNLNIIDITPYDSAEGLKDPLERIWIEGVVRVIDVTTMARYDAIDYPKKAYAKIHSTVEADDYKYRTAALLPEKSAPGIIPTVYNWQEGMKYKLAFSPAIQLVMHLVCEGIGGMATGMTAIGRHNADTYNIPQVDRTESNKKFRIGVCVAHPEHFAILPHAKYLNYLRGGTTTLHAFDEATSKKIVGKLDGKHQKYVESKEYATSGLPKLRGTQTKNYGDVFVYWVPKLFNDSIENARLLSCRGVWSDEHMKKASDEYQWAEVETNLKSKIAIPSIADHGLGQYANEKCWVSKGRYWASTEDSLDMSKARLTAPGFGPWRDFGVDAMDIFQNMPRRRKQTQEELSAGQFLGK